MVISATCVFFVSVYRLASKTTACEAKNNGGNDLFTNHYFGLFGFIPSSLLPVSSQVGVTNPLLFYLPNEA